MHSTIPVIFAAAVIGLTAAAAPASAKRGMRMFNQADTNKDGTVTKAEFDAARGALFARMDANGDGVIETSELRAWIRALPARIRDARFKSLDTNGDGKISADEYVSRRKSMFDKIDANNDSSVDKAEFDKAFEAFRSRMRHRQMRPRRAHDGHHHKRRHFGRRGGMGRWLERRMDLNGDGKVTRVEFDTLGQFMFLRLDRDGDGAIGKEEARKARPLHAPSSAVAATGGNGPVSDADRTHFEAGRPGDFRRAFCRRTGYTVPDG